MTDRDEDRPQGDPIEDVLPRGAVLATRLADGEWHRLHPATPLLRGGIVIIAIGKAASPMCDTLLSILDPAQPVEAIIVGTLKLQTGD